MPPMQGKGQRSTAALPRNKKGPARRLTRWSFTHAAAGYAARFRRHQRTAMQDQDCHLRERSSPASFDIAHEPSP